MSPSFQNTGTLVYPDGPCHHLSRFGTEIADIAIYLHPGRTAILPGRLRSAGSGCDRTVLKVRLISSSADRVGGIVKYLSIMPSSSEQLHSVAVRSGSALRARILWPSEINCAGWDRGRWRLSAESHSAEGREQRSRAITSIMNREGVERTSWAGKRWAPMVVEAR